MRRPVLIGAATLAAVATLSACSFGDGPERQRSAPTTQPTSVSGSPTAAPAQPLAITHIHAITRDPKSGELLLATHQGLFRQVDGQLRKAGPVIDLMGFAVGSDGTYYASGHPGVGVDLPQPVGLITSTDGGASWEVASRGGESDFHALTAGPGTVTGFDGALRTTTDNKTWTTHPIPAPPRDVAAAPKKGTLLATTSSGLLTSTDGGQSWTTLAPPEPAVLAAWADDTTAVIATTSGRLATSSDAGSTWTLHPDSIGTTEALSAHRTSDGQLEILAVVDNKVIRTTNAGASTETLVQ
ncbi:hypothetical protein JNO54_09060 [Janibacter sp. YIM B02568]|nr:hypothetical protein [Janibacter endophyticus]